MVQRIKKGDKVLVLSGKDKGKIGAVEKVLPVLARARVAGVNISKRHSRRGGRRSAGIIDINQPLSLSRLKLVCPHCSKATRVGIRLNAKKEKERYCKRCQALLT